MAQKVYQFKITLQEIKPKIWRRIQIIDSCSFWDLHVAIQDAMGWTDSHLHAFEVIDPKYLEEEVISSYAEDLDDDGKLTWQVKVKRYIYYNQKMIYQYDFGDDWQHLVELEKICEKDPKQKYPICLAGKRACPPEDVGGVGGYEGLLEILADKKHEQYKEMTTWLGRKYDPEYFDPAKVKFDSPARRLKFAYS